MREPKINIPKGKIADFCKQNQVRRLSLFGSILREDFGPDSDVDILVEIVGEASAKVSPESQAKYPLIPWPQVIGMRNRLIMVMTL